MPDLLEHDTKVHPQCTSYHRQSYQELALQWDLELQFGQVEDCPCLIHWKEWTGFHVLHLAVHSCWAVVALSPEKSQALTRVQELLPFLHLQATQGIWQLVGYSHPARCHGVLWKSCHGIGLHPGTA